MPKICHGLMMTGITLYLLAGANFLSLLGFHYISDGGSQLEKIHPGSFCITAAFGWLCLAPNSRPLWRGKQVISHIAGPLHALWWFAGAVLYAAIFSSTQTMAVLLDSFCPACLVAIISALDRPASAKPRINLVLALILINAIIAIAEAVCGHLLLPLDIDKSIGDSYPISAQEFRAMALYDHPLTGSAITLLGLLMAPPRGWGSIYRLVMLAALIGFGGRAALLIGLCALALLSLIAAHENPRPRALPPSVKIMAQLLGLLIFAGVFTVLSGAGTRLLAHLSWDSSAQARLWSWGILASLDAREIILGTSHADVIRHLQAIQLENGGMVVENFWIMMLITLGMCGFSLFLAGFWMLNRWLWRFTTARGKVILVALLLILSTNNSLARKSSILTITAFVVCARPIYVRAPRRQFAPAIAAANG